jgi:hypothetical protein
VDSTAVPDSQYYQLAKHCKSSTLLEHARCKQSNQIKIQIMKSENRKAEFFVKTKNRKKTIAADHCRILVDLSGLFYNIMP